MNVHITYNVLIVDTYWTYTNPVSKDFWGPGAHQKTHECTDGEGTNLSSSFRRNNPEFFGKMVLGSWDNFQKKICSEVSCYFLGCVELKLGFKALTLNIFPFVKRYLPKVEASARKS